MKQFSILAINASENVKKMKVRPQKNAADDVSMKVTGQFIELKGRYCYIVYSRKKSIVEYLL